MTDASYVLISEPAQNRGNSNLADQGRNGCGRMFGWEQLVPRSSRERSLWWRNGSNLFGWLWCFRKDSLVTNLQIGRSVFASSRGCKFSFIIISSTYLGHNSFFSMEVIHPTRVLSSKVCILIHNLLLLFWLVESLHWVKHKVFEKLWVLRNFFFLLFRRQTELIIRF